ncbi:MAG TPA: hypothetical protein VM261_18665 [Kofleriaceae bacterium]|nr:hypothetical protein [Kofleriaceae bacterium]
MAKRTIYDGQIAVADADYTHASEDDEGELVEAEIENLDAPVTSRAVVGFRLDYPFEKPFDGEVRGSGGGGGGVSLRQIIDAIRAAYRAMYVGTVAEPMEKLDNMHVRGPYGEAHHVIEDLVIETIALDDEAGTLEIFIGS